MTDFDLMEFAADDDLAGRLKFYFSSLETSHGALVSDAGIGLLLLQQSIEMSMEFRDFHPLVSNLQGVILDDSNTSDHHMLICAAPLKGMVLHLAHDGDSRIVFESLDAFLAAAASAHEMDEYVSEQHPEYPVIAEDQAALRQFLASLRAGENYGQTVPALVPALDLSDPEFLITLIGDDLFIGEAMAREIAARPAPELLPVAEFCERHPHVIVREAGALARASILDA